MSDTSKLLILLTGIIVSVFLAYNIFSLERELHNLNIRVVRQEVRLQILMEHLADQKIEKKAKK